MGRCEGQGARSCCVSSKTSWEIDSTFQNQTDVYEFAGKIHRFMNVQGNRWKLKMVSFFWRLAILNSFLLKCTYLILSNYTSENLSEERIKVICKD